MTHQTATVVVELRTRRDAEAPGADDLVRPLRARGKRRPAYIGLLSQRPRIQWRDQPRQKRGGQLIRMLSPEEIDEWHARLAEIMDGKAQPVRKPPLLEVSYDAEHEGEIRCEPSPAV